MDSGDPAASFGAVLVDIVEALEGIVPSHDVLAEGLRMPSEFAAARSIAGKDGFLKSPPTEARDLDGRLATDLEPDLYGSSP